MKTLLNLTVAALTLTSFAAPTFASVSDVAGSAFIASFDVNADTLIERRKPRVPGGSGCDDPRDVIEHPECRPIR